MKKFIFGIFAILAAMTAFVACEERDEISDHNRLYNVYNNHYKFVYNDYKTILNKLETNINSISQLVNAEANQWDIVSIEELPNGDKVIHFKDAGDLTIYNTANLITPGGVVKPTFAILENGELYISYDGGATWEETSLGKVVGEKGEKGDQGEKGDKGDQGEKGDKGDKGDQGEKGDKGDQGEKGDKGDKGDQGNQGEQGAQGEQGEAGQGSSGGSTVPSINFEIRNGDLYVTIDGDERNLGRVLGAQGPQGIQGEQGIQGPQGIQGETGPQGPQGELSTAVVTPKFKVNEGNMLVYSTNNGATWQQAGVITTTSGAGSSEMPTFSIEDGHLIATTSTGWQDLGSVKGSDGATGAQGPAGTTPEISVAKGSDGVYYWTLNGEWLTDANGARVPAQGPQGERGERGPKGEQGEQGSQGEPGTSSGGTTTVVPEISFTRIGDNLFYTVDGVSKPLGNIKGDKGDAGPTPQFRIVSDKTSPKYGYLQVSTNGGITYQDLGKVIGEKGEQGVQGASGVTPIIDIDSEGYWVVSVDGGITTTRISQATGGVKATGEAGKTPQFMIGSSSNGYDEGYWYVDYQDGSGWHKLGKAVGAQGPKGDKGEAAETPIFTMEGGALYYKLGETGSWTLLGVVKPEFRIVDDEWQMSTDGGSTWESMNASSKGNDALTPEYKIIDGYLCLSYDGWESKQTLGYVNGSAGVSPRLSIVDGEWWIDNGDGPKPTGQKATAINGKTPVFDLKGGVLLWKYTDETSWHSLGTVSPKFYIENGIWYADYNDDNLPDELGSAVAPLVPQFEVRTDGYLYMSYTGEHTPDSYEKVGYVKGANGASPLVRITDGGWEVSYDGGMSYIGLGYSAKGVDGKTPKLTVKNDANGEPCLYYYFEGEADQLLYNLGSLKGEKGDPGEAPQLKFEDGVWYAKAAGETDWTEVEYIDNTPSVSGYMSGYAFVDLGLESGTLWATYNVGATQPEQFGDYFWWGDVEGYSKQKTTVNFTDSNDNWCPVRGPKDGSDNPTLDKLKDKGYCDDNAVLLPEKDCATMIWGSDWRMPSVEQFRELVGNCSISSVEYKGISGLKFMSKNNRNWIFLPNAGIRRRPNVEEAGTSHVYGINEFAFASHGRRWFYNGTVQNSCASSFGLSVRPVVKK